MFKTIPLAIINDLVNTSAHAAKLTEEMKSILTAYPTSDKRDIVLVVLADNTVAAIYASATTIYKVVHLPKLAEMSAQGIVDILTDVDEPLTVTAETMQHVSDENFFNAILYHCSPAPIFSKLFVTGDL